MPSSDNTDTDDQPGHDEVYCISCGELIKEKAEICPECGVRQKEQETNTQMQQDSGVQRQQIKNPGVAAILSFFYSGLGQIYNGQIGKGIALIIIQVINVVLMFFLIGFITYPIVWVYGLYDAHKVAKQINKGEVVIQ